jgi:hypothetical protein
MLFAERFSTLPKLKTRLPPVNVRKEANGSDPFKALTLEGAVTGLADPGTDKDLRDT